MSIGAQARGCLGVGIGAQGVVLVWVGLSWCEYRGTRGCLGVHKGLSWCGYRGTGGCLQTWCGYRGTRGCLGVSVIPRSSL